MLEVAGLHHEFQIRQGWHRRPLVAVKDVSFHLARGRTVAVVGESGSGKSTLGRCVVRLVQPTRGQVRLDSVELLGLSAAAFRPFQRQLQMVFQDPGEALNPRLTVGEALDEPLRFWQGLARPQRQEKILHLLGQVQLDRSHATRYPHQLSGGQQQRVGIARALAADPQLIVLDEPTSALDVSVQAQILNLLVDLQAATQIAYLLISHDLWTVRYLAQEVLVLYLGQVMERGPVAEVFARPQHPYTRALLSMAPQLHGPAKAATLTLTGEVGNPLTVGTGCPLAPRCPLAQSSCFHTPQVLVAVAPGHSVACQVVTG
jgi:peptide/nickel transport system ATP-binding protein/oligopeptide transport system ATP-binding protein